MSAEIKFHLDEQKVTDLNAAAVLSDNYALTHKKSGFTHNKSYPVKSHWSGHSGVKPQTKTSNEDKGSAPKATNDKPDKGKTEQRFPPKFKKGPVCFHCKKTGHLMSDCWLLKKEKESQTQKTPVGFINSRKSEMAVEKPALLPAKAHVVPKLLQRFQGGVFESSGSVSPVGVTESENPLVVLRDTGAAQTVMLNSVLALSVDTDLHKSVLVECIGDTEYQSLPLHRVCLKSKYVTGDVTVDIVDKIPVEGVHMLLGYDIGGVQVNVCPVLCEKTVVDETCTLSVVESQLNPE